MDRLTDLIRRSHDGDKTARDTLVADNLGLVHMVVKRFENRGHEREELFQIGCIGLMKAIDQFDLSLNLALSTYAVPVITGEIQRFLRDDGMMRISRTIKENACKVSRARQFLCQELGREPNIVEVAAMTGLKDEDIVLALEAGREVESIYRPAYEKDGEEIFYIDRICSTGGKSFAAEEPEKEAVLNKIAVDQLLAVLEEKERSLIRMRYFENKTQGKTAEMLGMTQVQVSRMEKKILQKLRLQLKQGT